MRRVRYTNHPVYIYYSTVIPFNRRISHRPVNYDGHITYCRTTVDDDNNGGELR